jgi:hypothetical protein
VFFFLINHNKWKLAVIVSVISQLKVVRLSVFDEAVKASVACGDCPAGRNLAGSHLTWNFLAKPYPQNKTTISIMLNSPKNSFFSS